MAERTRRRGWNATNVGALCGPGTSHTTQPRGVPAHPHCPPTLRPKQTEPNAPVLATRHPPPHLETSHCPGYNCGHVPGYSCGHVRPPRPHRHDTRTHVPCALSPLLPLLRSHPSGFICPVLGERGGPVQCVVIVNLTTRRRKGHESIRSGTGRRPWRTMDTSAHVDFAWARRSPEGEGGEPSREREQAQRGG